MIELEAAEDKAREIYKRKKTELEELRDSVVSKDMMVTFNKSKVVSFAVNHMNRQILISNTLGIYLFSLEHNKFIAAQTYTDIFQEFQNSEILIIDLIQPIYLQNIFVGVKNRKQLIFFNADMEKGTDIGADSSGISEIHINQKSQEIQTLS